MHVIGASGTGKSTLLHAILALKQTAHDSAQRPALVPNGPFVKLNGFFDILHGQQGATEKWFSIGLVRDERETISFGRPSDKNEQKEVSIADKLEVSFVLGKESKEIEVEKSTLGRNGTIILQAGRNTPGWVSDEIPIEAVKDIPVSFRNFLPVLAPGATKPHAVCLVPERREELTTEGGLDVAGQHNTLKPVIAKLSDAGIRVSLFIAADPRQIEMAAKLRAPVIEIHTGAWCDAVVDGHAAKADAEWQRIKAGAKLARAAGLEVHAGHGLDYATAETIAVLPEIVELNIGYYMIGEAIFVGIGETVRQMRAAMARGRQKAESAK
jgi:pyridoxine 5'-phosphate synthase